MVKESSATPPGISTDAQQINLEDAVSENHSPAKFYPSPSREQTHLVCKRSNGTEMGFWYLEPDDGVDETCQAGGKVT
jgi:hypothetical protein